MSISFLSSLKRESNNQKTKDKQKEWKDCKLSSSKERVKET